MDICVLSRLTIIYWSFIGQLLLIVPMATLAYTNSALTYGWKSIKYSPVPI